MEAVSVIGALKNIDTQSKQEKSTKNKGNHD